MSREEVPERVAMCVHEHGTGDYVPLRPGEQMPISCPAYGECDCAPVEYVRVKPVDPENPSILDIVRELGKTMSDDEIARWLWAHDDCGDRPVRLLATPEGRRRAYAVSLSEGATS